MGYEDPDSDIELAAFIQQRLLQVLLDDPVLFALFLFNKLAYSFQAVENLDPFSLVQIRRLHQSKPLGALFLGEELL